MHSKFNYRIDAPISRKNMFYRATIYTFLFFIFGAASTASLYMLSSILQFDINVPIRQSSYSTLEVLGFFGAYLIILLALLMLLLQFAKKTFLWLNI
jgi:hypothetical protein